MVKKLSADDIWADALHSSFLDLVGLMNRPEPDVALLAQAGVKLDRALFPLLSRLGLHGPISVVELGNLVGKDHSTVSRQVGKLETLGLVSRIATEGDQRVRLLVPTPAGEAMLEQFRIARRASLGRWFGDWSENDKQQLLEYLQRMFQATQNAGDTLEDTEPATPPKLE